MPLTLTNEQIVERLTINGFNLMDMSKYPTEDEGLDQETAEGIEEREGPRTSAFIRRALVLLDPRLGDGSGIVVMQDGAIDFMRKMQLGLAEHALEVCDRGKLRMVKEVPPGFEAIHLRQFYLDGYTAGYAINYRLDGDLAKAIEQWPDRLATH